MKSNDVNLPVLIDSDKFKEFHVPVFDKKL